MIVEPKIKTLTHHETAQCYRIYDVSGISPTLRASCDDNNTKNTLVAIPVISPDRLNKRQNGRRFKEDGDPAFTLTTQDKHGVYDGKRIRRLTPKECERLQCFPDNFTEGVSDTQRYKCLGNAVTVPVVEYILKSMQEITSNATN